MVRCNRHLVYVIWSRDRESHDHMTGEFYFQLKLGRSNMKLTLVLLFAAYGEMYFFYCNITCSRITSF